MLSRVGGKRTGRGQVIDDVRPRGQVPEDEYVVFFGAGQDAAGAFRCAECGYGVAVRERLPRCPMCAGETWEPGPASAPGGTLA
jgi:hypothetical protein